MYVLSVQMCFFLCLPGAFYMFRVEELLCSGDYQSNRVTYLEDFGLGQGETVDIDTPEDFVRAELLVSKMLGRQ